jgi:hypothetical protein
VQGLTRKINRIVQIQVHMKIVHNANVGNHYPRILRIRRYPLPLPHLQTITLQTRYLPTDKLIEVASSRAKVGAPFKDVKVYRKVGRDGVEMENAKLRENLVGLVEGSVRVEMVPSDHQNSRTTVPEVCIVDDFSWRDRTKV